MKYCLLLFTFLVLTFMASTAEAVNLYVSPNGTGTRAGTGCANTSASTQCPRSEIGNTAVPGDVWILNNGTYNCTGSCIVLNGRNGTSSNHIRITGINPAGCNFPTTCPVIQWDGNNGHGVLIYNSTWIDLDNFVIKGANIDVNRSDSPLAVGGTSSDITIRQMVVTDQNRYTNGDAVLLQGTNILFEDSDVLRSARNFVTCNPFSTSNVTIRRVYISQAVTALKSAFLPPGLSDWGPIDGFVFYNCVNSIVENSIAEGMISAGSGTDGSFTGWGNNNQVLGSIGINNHATWDFDNGPAPSYGNGQGWIGKDLVSINNVSGDGVGRCLRNKPSVAQSTISNVTCFGGTFYAETTDSSSGFSDPPVNITATNILVVGPMAPNNTSGPSAFALLVNSGGTAFTSRILQYSQAFNVGNTFGGSPGWSTSNIPTSVNPNLGACKIFIPAGTPYKGIGQGGADIGANVLYAYVDGKLTNTPLWSAAGSGTANYGKMQFGPPVVTGINDSGTGLVRSTVHQRIGLGTSGCTLPSGYGGGLSVVTVTITNPTSNPTYIATTTPLQGATALGGTASTK